MITLYQVAPEASVPAPPPLVAETLDETKATSKGIDLLLLLLGDVPFLEFFFKNIMVCF